MEARNLPGTEFNELRGRIDKLSENFNKERVNIKKDMGTIKKKIINEESNT